MSEAICIFKIVLVFAGEFVCKDNSSSLSTSVGISPSLELIWSGIGAVVLEGFEDEELCAFSSGVCVGDKIFPLLALCLVER
jgi:hypothetical protein